MLGHSPEDEVRQFERLSEYFWRSALEGTVKGGFENKGFGALTPFFLDQVEATQTFNSPIWTLRSGPINVLDRAAAA
jgi:hypothetical protein